MNWIAKYQEARTWKKLLSQLTRLNQQHNLAHGRQVHREAERLRLRTAYPKAVAELRISTSQLQAKMLDDWRKFVDTPAVIGGEVKVDPIDLPPPPLSYAFKFPDDYGGAEWRKAVDEVGTDYRTALYAIFLLEQKLSDKQSRSTKADKEHFREAIRRLTRTVHLLESEQIRKEKEAADATYAAVEAFEAKLKMRPRGEDSSEFFNTSQPMPLLNAFRDRLRSRHSRLRGSVAVVEEVVDGAATCALRIFFVSRNRNRLLLVVTWDGLIRWEWPLNDGGTPWVRVDNYYAGRTFEESLSDLTGIDRALDWTDDLLNERIAVMSAIDVDGTRFESLSPAELDAKDFKRGSVRTTIRSWSGKLDQEFGPTNSGD